MSKKIYNILYASSNRGIGMVVKITELRVVVVGITEKYPLIIFLIILKIRHLRFLNGHLNLN